MESESPDWLEELSEKSRSELAKLPSSHQPTWFRLRVTQATGLSGQAIEDAPVK